MTPEDYIITPEDYFSPDWENKEKVHDWKNYASDGLIRIWGDFTLEQKLVIAQSLQKAADLEEWE
ncbi:recombinase RecA [Klebsiella quasipneumoniae]|uniref:recombinase RecA n=1 Tax=Klebsiella quasipneumoniae TaxID=1463165 RepID=UPI001E402253|nr:recombinase RecA [Klebsiella quasipneumoniae]